jgi:MFS family permease
MTPHAKAGLVGCVGVAFLIVDVLGLSSVSGWLSVRRRSTGLASAGIFGLAAAVAGGIVGGLVVQVAWWAVVRDEAGRNVAPGCFVVLGALYTVPIAFLAGMTGGRVAGARTWRSLPRGDDPVVVMTAASSEEAMVVESLFQAESIPAFYRGVEIFVPRDRFEEAQSLMQSFKRKKDTDA